MSKKELQTNKVIFFEIKTLIEESKQRVAVVVNSTMTSLYWNIGKRINKEVLQEKRAEYGKQIVQSLSIQLREEYGSTFSAKNLRRMMQFAEKFPDNEIVATLWRQLTWSHFKLLIPIKEPLKREFYIEMCKMEKWSVGY
jgi:DUF1016 N-terminal domain